MLRESGRIDPLELLLYIQDEMGYKCNIDGAMGVYTEDIDGDGDIDVIAAVEDSNSLVAWWENDGSPSGANWDQHNIDTDLSEPHSVFAIKV